jgi:peptidoglycan/xylan/chitin deacetylase (PgdA/CDA1 family)
MPPDREGRLESRARRPRRDRVRRRRRALLLAAAVLAAGLIALALAVGGSGSPRPRAPRHSASGSPRPVSGAPGRTATPEPSAEVRALIALGRPIYCAPPRGNEVALTFDDGPGPYTRLMLAKLRKHDARATFFVVGRNIGLVRGAALAEQRIGAVGDHTWTHPVLTELGGAQAEAEIVRTQRALERSTHAPVFLFRPPYGAHDARVDAIARSHGLLEILWSVDSADSLGADYAGIERNVIAGLRPGAIILMHENHGQTVRAMLTIFAALQRRHLRPVSVPQLLTDDPPSAGRVRHGAAACGVRTLRGRSGG